MTVRLFSTAMFLFAFLCAGHAAHALELPPLKEKAAALFSKNEQAAPPADKARVVKLYRIGRGVSQSGISFAGKVEAAQKARLFFRVSGPVVQRDLYLGKPVSKGDVLMRLDPRDYQRVVDDLNMQIKAMEAQNALAGVQYERKKKLVASKSISRVEFDSAEVEKKASDAQLMALRVNLKKASDALSDTVLLAPFSGNVTSLGVELHELAQAGQTVVVLEDLRSLRVRIHIPSGRIPETLTAPIKGQDQQFSVRIPGRSETCLAVLKEFSPSSSADGESFEAVLAMDQPATTYILPGMSVEAVLYTQADTGSGSALSVPWSAVVSRKGSSFVWSYDEKTRKLSRRSVTAARASGSDSALVKGDLKPGDLIVAAGGDWLNESMQVTVLNPEVLDEAH